MVPSFSPTHYPIETSGDPTVIERRRAWSPERHDVEGVHRLGRIGRLVRRGPVD